MLKTYAMLTKPGIILGNLVTTAGGFALASRGVIDIRLFFATVTGLSFVIASAGIFNNYIDRVIDAKMERTKNRGFVTGSASISKALTLAGILGCVGLFSLFYNANFVTAFVASFGLFVYLVLYAFLKTRSFYGTLVGSVAGAVPPVVGYCAVSNQFDLGAFILFAILVLWQMPHFFAIAIYRLEDYAAAAVPVLPLQKGIPATKMQMVSYIFAFILASLSLTFFGYTSNFFALMATLFGAFWLLCFLTNGTLREWGYRLFVVSLFVIMGLFATIFLEFSLSFS